MKQTINQRIEELEKENKDLRESVKELRQCQISRSINAIEFNSKLQKRVIELEAWKTEKEMPYKSDDSNIWLWAIALFSAINLLLTLTK